MEGSPGARMLLMRALWQPWVILVAFVLANVGDSVSTFAGLNRGAIEANFFISGLMGATSMPVALTIKVILAIGISILVMRWKPRALVVPTIFMTLTAVSNTLITLTVL